MFIHEIINQAPSDHVAIEGDERVTYGELRNLVSLYRNQLYEMGIRRGMKVGLYSANRAEFIYVHLAVISLGAVIIPINNSLVDREVDYILKDGEASLLVTDTKLSVSIPSVDIHDLDFQARQRKASEAPAFPSDLTEDEVCAFVYTSGTTGSPKGAMLTHRNLVRNVEQFTQMVIFKPEDKILCVLPMFHCYGLPQSFTQASCMEAPSLSFALRIPRKSSMPLWSTVSPWLSWCLPCTTCWPAGANRR